MNAGLFFLFFPKVLYHYLIQVSKETPGLHHKSLLISTVCLFSESYIINMTGPPNILLISHLIFFFFGYLHYEHPFLHNQNSMEFITYYNPRKFILSGQTLRELISHITIF